MKFPIGIQDFAKIRLNNLAYVDKTDLVYELASVPTTYFLSRPRRFGKSLLLSTLSYYFQGRHELFEGLAIEKLEKEWKRHPVIHISFSNHDFSGDLEQLPIFIDSALSTYEAEYGVEVSYRRGFGLRLVNLLRAVHSKAGTMAVVLIDDCDKPILDTVGQKVNDIDLELHNNRILNAFYGALKDADPHLRFALLTGVTKVLSDSLSGGFDHADDISLSDSFESICGFTDDDLLSTFHERITEMASQNGCDFDSMISTIKRLYGGFHFGSSMTDIYNPSSLINILNDIPSKGFPFSTETPTYLARLLKGQEHRAMKLAGNCFDELDFLYLNATSILSLLYRNGYFTIKEYGWMRNVHRLGFPNEEAESMFNAFLAKSGS